MDSQRPSSLPPVALGEQGPPRGNGILRLRAGQDSRFLQSRTPGPHPLTCPEPGQRKRGCSCESDAQCVLRRLCCPCGRLPRAGAEARLCTRGGMQPPTQLSRHPHSHVGCDLQSVPLGNPRPHAGWASVLKSAWEVSGTNPSQTERLLGPACVYNQVEWLPPGWSPQAFPKALPAVRHCPQGSMHGHLTPRCQRLRPSLRARSGLPGLTASGWWVVGGGLGFESSRLARRSVFLVHCAGRPLQGHHVPFRNITEGLWQAGPLCFSPTPPDLLMKLHNRLINTGTMPSIYWHLDHRSLSGAVARDLCSPHPIQIMGKVCINCEWRRGVTAPRCLLAVPADPALERSPSLVTTHLLRLRC